MRQKGGILLEAVVALFMLSWFLGVFVVSNHNLARLEASLRVKAQSIFSVRQQLVEARNLPISVLQRTSGLIVQQNGPHDYTVALNQLFCGTRLTVHRLE